MKTASRAVIREKKSRLREDLKRRSRILVAFSGGKDSFFLLREAILTLGRANVTACFVSTPFTSESSRERIAYFNRMFPFPLREFRIDLLEDVRLRRNPKRRCFICKQRMFTVLKREAKKLGIETVADGSTVSDLEEHRPGRMALQKMAIASPLQSAGFTGNDIVADLKNLGVEDYFLTSSTCLATRFPYDFPLTDKKIIAIGQVEHYLAGRGIYPLRVRYMTDGVRIETGETNFQKILALKSELLAFCRDREFKFITLDLGGIKSGSWD